MNNASEALKILGSTGEYWGKEFYNSNDKFCSIGAYLEVTGGSVLEAHKLEDEPEVEHLAKVITEQYPDRLGRCNVHDALGTVYEFNDHDNTTFDDIRRVFEKTAVWIDEQV